MAAVQQKLMEQKIAYKKFETNQLPVHKLSTFIQIMSRQTK